MQPASSSSRITLLLATTLSVLLPGCLTGSTPESDTGESDSQAAEAADPTEAVPLVRPERWRSEIASPDPRVRASAADMVPADPGPDGAQRLQDLVLLDPDATVRERALFAYGGVLDKGAVPLLKSVALADQDDAVRSAALAEIHRIRQQSPEPPRGFLNMVFPEHFEIGKPFQVRVTFGSDEDVPEAQLGVRVPRELEVLSREEAVFHGPLEAGKTEELVLTLEAKSQVRSSVRLHLKLDYPEMLDVEVLNRKLRVVTQDQTGTLSDATPADWAAR